MVAERKSNFELLRILAIVGVVILHFNLEGALLIPEMNINKAVVLFLEGLFVCATDLFVMISGYFMVDKTKVSLWKPLNLVLQMVIIQLALYALELIMGNAEFSKRMLISLLIPKNYFLVLYVALYLICPYINLALNSCSEKGARTLILVVFLLFSVWSYGVEILGWLLGISLNSSNTVSFSGSLSGYTIVNFAMCYIFGAAIKKKIIHTDRLWLLFGISLAAVLAMPFIDLGYSIYYNSPFVIGFAVSLIMFTEKVSFRCPAVNKLAKGAFTVYLINIPVLERLDILAYAQRSLPVMLMYMVFTVVLIYAVGYLIHLVYEFVSAIVFKPLKAWAEKVVISV